MWGTETVSVVLPTFNEAASIRHVIGGFESLGLVDEIIVVNNNAAAGTSEALFGTSAREIFEPVQGYGAAIRRGLAEATGDLVVLCEPDGTFAPEDLLKLLPFTTDADVVVGSRTVQIFIWDGANMGRFLKWGNWFVAKLIEVLFGTTYLSDVGCTFRVMRRHVVRAALPRARLTGSAFGLELLMRSVVAGDAIVQVPVRYLARVGQSSATGRPREALAVGTQMLGVVLRFRFWPRSMSARAVTPRGGQQRRWTTRREG